MYITYLGICSPEFQFIFRSLYFIYRGYMCYTYVCMCACTVILHARYRSKFVYMYCI